jgi:hypothetical protein
VWIYREAERKKERLADLGRVLIIFGGQQNAVVNKAGGPLLTIQNKVIL